jgi:hypothetical protein
MPLPAPPPDGSSPLPAGRFAGQAVVVTGLDRLEEGT